MLQSVEVRIDKDFGLSLTLSFISTMGLAESWLSNFDDQFSEFQKESRRI